MGVESKAKRMLAENRVTVIKITRTHILARVQGSELDPYRVNVFKNGKWDCECKYFQKGLAEDSTRVWECSHALAVKLTPVYREWILGLLDKLINLNEEKKGELDGKNNDHSLQEM